ncbi:MAG: integrin alpha [Planctomycetota bacterium]
MTRSLRLRWGCLASLLLPIAAASTQSQVDQFSRLRILPGVPEERWLYSVKPASDLNADGYYDYLVHYGGGYICGGCPGLVVLASGLDARSLWVYPSPYDPVSGPGGEADLGDFDGDRRQDLVLGWEQVLNPSGTGRGILIAQAVDGSRILWTRSADDGVWYMGQRLKVAGDVTGDGIDDVIVHAQHIDGYAPNAGRVYVLSGRDGSDVYVYTGTIGGDGLGLRIHHGVGDADADGYVDFAYSSDRRHSMSIHSGRDGLLLWEIVYPDENVGYTVAAPGDLDGDGFDDLVYSLGLWPNPGRAVAASVLDRRVIWEFDYPTGVAHMFLDQVADIDHDGINDVLLSNTGRDRDDHPRGSVIALSGSTGTMLWELRDVDQPKDVERFGDEALGMGDVNGDGLRDLTIFRTVLPDHNREALIYTRNTLHKVSVGTMTRRIDLSLYVPSCPDRIFALLFAMGEGSVPLGLRYVPLAPDWLLLWSVGHPLWGVLDAQGKATINVASHLSLPGGPASGEFSCAGIVFDPSAPFGIRTITNRVVLEEE